MNGLVKTVAAAALIVASTAASAQTTFDFSYLFGDGQQVTGSFTGLTTDGGQSVTNIANLQVALNGISFAPVGSVGNALQLNAWSPSTASFSPQSTPVTIYANGNLNNFIISDVDASTSTSADYEFAYINDATNGLYQAVAANFLQSDAFSGAGATQLAIDDPVQASSWSLTEVPLPSTLLLLGSGLGLLGFAGRRRLAA